MRLKRRRQHTRQTARGEDRRAEWCERGLGGRGGVTTTAAATHAAATPRRLLYLYFPTTNGASPGDITSYVPYTAFLPGVRQRVGYLRQRCALVASGAGVITTHLRPPRCAYVSSHGQEGRGAARLPCCSAARPAIRLSKRNATSTAACYAWHTAATMAYAATHEHRATRRRATGIAAAWRYCARTLHTQTRAQDSNVRVALPPAWLYLIHSLPSPRHSYAPISTSPSSRTHSAAQTPSNNSLLFGGAA